jgi:hypothetical protein
MDADEAKAEWFNAFRNILLFIRVHPRPSASIRANPRQKSFLKGSRQ